MHINLYYRYAGWYCKWATSVNCIWQLPYKYNRNTWNVRFAPKLLFKQKLIILLKPGKQPDNPYSNRPLYMLDSSGKILESIFAHHSTNSEIFHWTLGQAVRRQIHVGRHRQSNENSHIGWSTMASGYKAILRNCYPRY